MLLPLKDRIAYIHCWIAQSYRRRGIATEALNQMCQISRELAVLRAGSGYRCRQRGIQGVAARAGFRYQPEQDHLDEQMQRARRRYAAPARSAQAVSAGHARATT